MCAFVRGMAGRFFKAKCRKSKARPKGLLCAKLKCIKEKALILSEIKAFFMVALYSPRTVALRPVSAAGGGLRATSIDVNEMLDAVTFDE